MSASHEALPAAATVIASPERRAVALRDALVDRGLVEAGEAEALAHRAPEVLSPANGARVVARTWVDPDFRKRLLAHATAAANELGIEGIEGHQMVAVENTTTTHNVIVCTQCSCTAWPLLGLPPDWYKSRPYRARVARSAGRVEATVARRPKYPWLGHQWRDAICGVADATSGNRASHGRTTRQSRYSGCADRCCSYRRSGHRVGESLPSTVGGDVCLGAIRDRVEPVAGPGMVRYAVSGPRTSIASNFGTTLSASAPAAAVSASGLISLRWANLER
jgi:hypothetical protein